MDRVYRFGTIALLVVVVVGCGGKATVSSSIKNEPTLADPIIATDANAIETQPTQGSPDVPAGPGGFGIIAPLSLPHQVTDASTSKAGNQFESRWPSQWVADVGRGSLIFLPHWDEADPGYGDMSYAMYSLAIPEPTGNYSILFDWQDGIDNYGNLWIGVGNFDRNTWDWQPAHESNVVAFPAEGHLSGSDQIYLAVVCLGSSQWELNRITPSATNNEALHVQCLTATKGTFFAKVVVSWDQTIGADGYKLQYKNNDGGSPSTWTDLGSVSGGSNTSFEHTLDSPVGKECAHYTAFDYRAKGTYQTHESSEWSNSDSGYRVLGDVTGMSATNGITHDKIIVSWDEVPGAERYKLQYKSNDGGLPDEWIDLQVINGGATTSFNHWVTSPPGKGSEPNTEYEYRAKAEFDSFESLSWSLTASGYRTNQWHFKWVDTAGLVGWYSSLAIVDGNPAVSYYDRSNGDLKYVRAITADGKSWGSPIAVDTDGIVGWFTSMVVVNEFPAICYFDDSNDSLKFVRATDASGSTWGTPLTVDTLGAFPRYLKLAVVNGNPAISYCDVISRNLCFVRATDADGSTWGLPVTADDSGEVGLEHSLQIVDGYPAISYCHSSNINLKYVRATDANGDSWGTPISVDALGNVGYYNSMAIVNGIPAVTYLESNFSNGNLKFVRATDVSGDSWEEPIVLDAPGDVGHHVSMAVVNGRPAISYFDRTSSNLKFIQAADANGITWEPPVNLETSQRNGAFTSLAVQNGSPIISYFEDYNDDLKFAYVAE